MIDFWEFVFSEFAPIEHFDTNVFKNYFLKNRNCTKYISTTRYLGIYILTVLCLTKMSSEKGKPHTVYNQYTSLLSLLVSTCIGNLQSINWSEFDNC